MTNHNPDDSAGAQLAMLVVLKLLLQPYRGNLEAIGALEQEFESTRAMLLGSSGTDRKIAAFDTTAESFLSILTAAP